MRIKRISLGLLVAVIAFALGVGIATYYRLRGPVPRLAAPKLKAESRGCFPGKSFQLHTTGNPAYFPTDAVSKFQTEWYSKHLAAMKEASLYASENDAVESYRFLWLRSFHHPVAVRIWKTETDQFISLNALTLAGFKIDSPDEPVY